MKAVRDYEHVRSMYCPVSLQKRDGGFEKNFRGGALRCRCESVECGQPFIKQRFVSTSHLGEVQMMVPLAAMPVGKGYEGNQSQ